MDVFVEHNRLHVGERFSMAFHRTLRIPDDGRQYPLPPGLGFFPLKTVADYASRVPASWRERGGFFIPMYQREALWLGFDGAAWKPNAVKVGIGGIDAISGQPWRPGLHHDPQDYVVVPDQPWLDGIKAGEGFVRQFVAVPLGSGYTVEGQLTGDESLGGMDLLVFEPKPGLFPDQPPQEQESTDDYMTFECAVTEPMGLAAGGRMTQAIYPDPYGITTWDPDSGTAVAVHIVNTEQYRAVTGEDPPPSPIDARAYTERGFPWFELYDEQRGDIAAPERLRRVKSIADLDSTRGHDTADPPVDVKRGQVRRVRPGKE